MKIYRKESKKSRKSWWHYYFGDYWEIDIGISLAIIDHEHKNNIWDNLHYHTRSHEFYIVLQWEGFIEIEWKEYILNTHNVVMVEPNEKHKVLRATTTPFQFIAISTEKNPDDKVIVV